MPHLSKLVDDIYGLLGKLEHGISIEPDLKPYMDEFLLNIKEAVESWAVPQQKGGLRMSNVGRPNRQLWFMLKNGDTQQKENDPALQFKFLYGHLLEQVALLLAKAAGHSVEQTQGQVEVEGIKGHMDAIIDGEVVDIKTAAPASYLKFVNGTLPDNDPFGYIAQLSGYESHTGTFDGGFLAINKVSGEMALYQPDIGSKIDIKKKISTVKALAGVDTPPELCYNDEPHGKAGNMVINRLCRYCDYKEECRKDTNEGKGLRKFAYASGITHFTHIEKEPNVREVV